MPVSNLDQERVVRLLTLDVAATIGSEHASAIETTAAHTRAMEDDPDQYERRVIDDVQQYFHDTFVDTTWPKCPHHLNHPLWFGDGWWRCERETDPVARLGELSRLRPYSEK